MVGYIVVIVVEMRRGVVEVRGGGPGRRPVRQETSRFLSTEEETRLRTNLDTRRTRTEAEDMDVFDDAASDRGSVRDIVTHMEGRGQQQQRTGRQDKGQANYRKWEVGRDSSSKGSRVLLVNGREMSLMWEGV